MVGNPGGHGTGNPYHDPKTGQFGFGARRSKKQASTRQRQDAKTPSRGLSRRSGGTSFTDWSANPKDAYANLTVDDGVEDLTAGEIGSINTYSISVGFRMNYDLRQAAKDPTYDTEAWTSDRKNLDSAMKRSSLTENTVLYRGYVPESPYGQQIENMKVGEGYTDPGFMSTSLTRLDASPMLMDFTASMRIYAPKGSKAIVTGSHNMFGGGEMDEVILDRDSTLVFTGKGDDGVPEFRLSQSGIHDAKPFTDYEQLPQKTQPAAAEQLAPPTEQEVSDEINRIWKTHGLDHLWMHYDKLTGYLDLDSIRVKRGERNQGKGAAAMRDVTAFADKYGLGMTLETAVFDADTGRPTRKRLQKFYKQFGFVLRKGKYYDASLSGDMVRSPKKVTQPADRVIDTENFQMGALDKARVDAMLFHAKDLAKSLNYDPDKVIPAYQQRSVKLGNRTFTPAADFNPDTGEIRIFPAATTLSLGGIMAHETMHAKFDRYMKDLHEQTQQVLATPEPGRNYQGGRYYGGGRSAVMEASGLLREPYASKYPLYQSYAQLTSNFDELIADDGVTPYSTEWWDAWRTQRVNDQHIDSRQAVNETLAEMARVDFQNDKVPGTKRWQDFYKAVNDHWTEYVTKQKRQHEAYDQDQRERDLLKGTK